MHFVGIDITSKNMTTFLCMMRLVNLILNLFQLRIMKFTKLYVYIIFLNINFVLKINKMCKNSTIVLQKMYNNYKYINVYLNVLF